MARKQITDVVKKKLFSIAVNQCYFPGCIEQIYNCENDVLLGEICHIEAKNPSGPRYNPNCTEESLDSFENLILLCPNHHTLIDKNEDEFNVEKLQKIEDFLLIENQDFNKIPETRIIHTLIKI